jgi:hypothetical protein
VTDCAVGAGNRVRRLRELARYDRATLHAILDAALVAQVGFVDGGRPCVIPMFHASSVWAGVVPIAHTLGDPVPDPRLAEGTPVSPAIRALAGRRL